MLSAAFIDLYGFFEFLGIGLRVIVSFSVIFKIKQPAVAQIFQITLQHSLPYAEFTHQIFGTVIFGSRYMIVQLQLSVYLAHIFPCYADALLWLQIIFDRIIPHDKSACHQDVV